MHTLLLFVSLFFDVPQKSVPPSKCFVVHSVVPAENDHEYYWATYSNSCRREIDAVYIMIDFMYRNEKVGTATWMMHFVTPGMHRTTRFSAPPNLPPYTHIRVHEITSDPTQALKY
jgi:hypothetical protein